MKRFKVLAIAASALFISACATSYDPPYADRTTYVAPMASVNTTGSAQPGAGAAGGGGAGAPRR